METFFSPVLTIVAALLAVPVAVFLIEVIAAVARPRGNTGFRPSTHGTPRPRIAVVVPAHNESTGLLPTLQDVQKQLRSDDRVLVVADNCTDDTAAAARTFGAEVVERHDLSRRGKGYALDFALQHLSSNPPDIVIMVDADCRLAENTINELAVTCAATQRPTQALYLMVAPTGSKINSQVAEFAWRVKNWLRPLGLSVLHLPCQLAGAGMAFPWSTIHGADLATGSVVEDLKLGLDLAAKGHSPIFCPAARVTSQFPSSDRAVRTQRERWEHGHIHTILSFVPRLVSAAIAQRNWKLFALTLDLAVPPLSLLAMLVIGIFVITHLYAIAFSSSAWLVAQATLAAFFLAVFLSWLKCGRDLVPITSVFSIVRYILGKLGLYRVIFSNRASRSWVRTDRSNSDENSP